MAPGNIFLIFTFISAFLFLSKSKPTPRDRNFICSIGKEGREDDKNEKYKRTQTKGQSCSGQEGGKDKKETDTWKPFPSHPKSKQFRFGLIGQETIRFYLEDEECRTLRGMEKVCLEEIQKQKERIKIEKKQVAAEKKWLLLIDEWIPGRFVRVSLFSNAFIANKWSATDSFRERAYN